MEVVSRKRGVRQDRQRRAIFDQRVARVRRRGWLCLFLGLVAGLVTGVALARFPSALEDQRALEAARYCGPASVHRSADCVVSIAATVVAKRETAGRDQHDYVRLTGTGTPSGEIGFVNHDFYARLATGQSVEALTWRSRIVVLQADGDQVPTDGNPEGGPGVTLTVAFAGLAVTAWLAYLVFWYLRRPRLAAARPAPPALVLPSRVACVAVLPGFVAVVVMMSLYAGHDTTLPPTAGLLVLAGLLLLACASLLNSWMRRPGEVYFRR